jgi:hypothetical protein
MEKNTEKKKLSGWDRRKMKEIATCGKLDAYFSCGGTVAVGKLGTPTTSALESHPSQPEDVSTSSFSLGTRDGAGPVEPDEEMEELIQSNPSGSEDLITPAEALADYHPKAEDDDDDTVRCTLGSVIVGQ